MPKFTFTSPDGKAYDIEGPDGATPEQAFGVLQQQLKAQPEPSNVLERGLLGPLQAGGTAVINMGGRAVNAVSDLVHRLGGNDSAPPLVGTMETPQAGKDYLHDVANVPGVGAVGGALHAAQSVAQKGDEAINSIGPVARDLNQGAGKVASDVLDIAPAAGAVSGARNALRSTVAESAVPGADIEGALHGVGFRNLPSKTADASIPARAGASVIGESTLAPAMTLNNQAVATRLAQHEAGIPEGQELNYANLARARAAGPGKVYNAAHDALPPQLTQDQPLQSALASIGDTTSQLPKSPDVDALKSTMLSQPGMTNDQLFSNIQQARDRASRFYASDQPDAHAMGDAYQSVANAYEDFVGRQLAANPASPVSLKDWQDARTQFAKNYAVQAATQGKDVKISTIARMQQKDPENLTGGLRLIAEQGNRFPSTSGFGPSTLADAQIGSSGSLAGQTARHITGPAIGGGIGALLGGTTGAAVGAGAGAVTSNAFNALIRRALAGNPALGEAAAARGITDPRLASFFDQPTEEAPPGPLELRPPPGRAFEPHQPALATGAPTQRDFFGTGANAVPQELKTGAGGPAPTPGGDISLADLLSHGVERPPEPGLTAGPMGAPKAEGIPFKVNADHAAGDLELAHEPTLGDLMDDLRSMPEVMHQNKSLGVGTDARGGQGRVMATDPGVPDGTMTRTANNASGESSASLEAINRTRREQAEGQDRFLVDQDGKMWPIRGVDAADATAPKGSIIVQKGIGGEPYSILDRGGLPRANAHGLLNRALAGGHGMNLGDLLGGS